MATCLGELNCSYEEYCNMSWAEFQTRLFAFNRIEKNQWFKIGEIITSIVQSGFLDGKDKKKIITDVKRIYQGTKKEIGLNDFQKEVLLKAQNEYNNRQK